MFEYRSTPQDPTYEARRQALAEAIRFYAGDPEVQAESVVVTAKAFHAFLVGGAR